MWTAHSDLSCVWLQKRRLRASCDMRRDRRPPNRLMYETAAVLSIQTNTCLANSSGRNCHKARCTAKSSRQFMIQSSRGPDQSPEAACLLHVAPQPVLEAYVETTTCRDTCSKDSTARRKVRSFQGLKERRYSYAMFTWSVPWRHAHLGTQECNQCWSDLIATWVAWLRLRMPYASGASEIVSVEPHSCLWWNSSSSALIGCARPWGTPSYSPSLTQHREKWFSAHGRACSFPSWPETPIGWGAGAPSPCDCTTVLGIGPEWANRWDSWPVMGQGHHLWPSWRHRETGRARRGGELNNAFHLNTEPGNRRSKRGLPQWRHATATWTKPEIPSATRGKHVASETEHRRFPWKHENTTWNETKDPACLINASISNRVSISFWTWWIDLNAET